MHTAAAGKLRGGRTMNSSDVERQQRREISDLMRLDFGHDVLIANRNELYGR